MLALRALEQQLMYILYGSKEEEKSYKDKMLTAQVC